MTRLAVISDIHGNCVALDAVLSDIRAEGIDQVVCLGDVAQGGSQPAESIDRLRELGCPVVMGNADAWLATGENSGAEQLTERHIEVRDWSVARLGEDRLTFIKGFSPTIEAEAGEWRFVGFHGSPKSFDDVLLPDTPQEELEQMLAGLVGAVCAGGHTHVQYVRRLGDGFFFNPGSVGVAYFHHQDPASVRFDPWAEYAILAAERGVTRLEFRRVPIDVDELVRVTRASGVPYGEGIVARYSP